MEQAPNQPSHEPFEPRTPTKLPPPEEALTPAQVSSRAYRTEHYQPNQTSAPTQTSEPPAPAAETHPKTHQILLALITSKILRRNFNFSTEQPPAPQQKKRRKKHREKPYTEITPNFVALTTIEVATPLVAGFIGYYIYILATQNIFK